MSAGSPVDPLLNERRRLARLTRLLAVDLGAAAAIGTVVAFLPGDTDAVVPTVLLLLVVLVTALVGGALAGIGAAVLASLGMTYAFIPPRSSFDLRATDHIVSAALFAFAALAVALAVRTLEVANRRVTREKTLVDALDGLSATLGTTLDPDLASLLAAQALVPVIADTCTIDLLRADGTLQRVAAADARPSADALVAALRRMSPDPANDRHPAVQAVRTGAPVVVRRVKDSLLRAMAGDEEHLEVNRKLRPVSFLAVPLVHQGEIVGALTLAHTVRTRRRFSVDDIPMALEIASRVGRAVRNAQRFEADRREVEILQRSLLPEEPPQVEGVRIRSVYRPAAAEVGGDWYAVVPLPPGRVGLAVGDVAGHGLGAATVMANVRFALKAIAFDGAKPVEVLTRLNEMLFHYANDTFVTACYGVLDLDAMRWQQALAGHVPPVLARSGAATLLDSPPGPPLGVSREPAFSDEAFVVGPDSVLLLYSDGLIERRGESLSVGLDRLRRAVTSAPRLDLEALPAQLADPDSSDDVILLSAEIIG